MADTILTLDKVALSRESLADYVADIFYEETAFMNDAGTATVENEFFEWGLQANKESGKRASVSDGGEISTTEQEAAIKIANRTSLFEETFNTGLVTGNVASAGDTNSYEYQQTLAFQTLRRDQNATFLGKSITNDGDIVAEDNAYGVSGSTSTTATISAYIDIYEAVNDQDDGETGTQKTAPNVGTGTGVPVLIGQNSVTGTRRALTRKLLQTVANRMKAKGGKATTLYANNGQLDRLVSFFAENTQNFIENRINSSDGMAKQILNAAVGYIVLQHTTLEIKFENDMPDDRVYFVNPESVKIAKLNGIDYMARELPETHRARRGVIHDACGVMIEKTSDLGAIYDLPV